MSAGRQSCVIVSQRSGRADPNPPEGQPVAKETIILPEYYMVRRGEPTTAEEYTVGCMQFKALHPGEGVPPRNTTWFDDVEDGNLKPDYRQEPPVVKPRIVRKVKQTEPTPDQPIYRSILNLVDCLDEEHSFKLLKHLAELNGMEIE